MPPKYHSVKKSTLRSNYNLDRPVGQLFIPKLIFEYIRNINVIISCLMRSNSSIQLIEGQEGIIIIHLITCTCARHFNNKCNWSGKFKRPKDISLISFLFVNKRLYCPVYPDPTSTVEVGVDWLICSSSTKMN